MIQLTEDQLREYASEFFRNATHSYEGMEDVAVDTFVRKIVEKHRVQVSITGNSLNRDEWPILQNPYVPRIREQTEFAPQQQQPTLFDGLLQEQANEAESKF